MGLTVLGAATGAAVGAAIKGAIRVPSVAASVEVFLTVVGAVLLAAGGMMNIIFEESVVEDTIRPNEGIYHSLRTAAVGAAVGAAVVVAGGVAVVVAVGTPFGSTFLTSGGAVGAAAGGVLGGAWAFGGMSVCQHYLLRLLLWRSRRFPRNITTFLDWAAQRVLVQRVGGGWRFVHRTLQERFAERYDEKYPGERRQKLPTETLPAAALSENKP